MIPSKSTHEDLDWSDPATALWLQGEARTILRDLQRADVLANSGDELPPARTIDAITDRLCRLQQALEHGLEGTIPQSDATLVALRSASDDIAAALGLTHEILRRVDADGPEHHQNTSRVDEPRASTPSPFTIKDPA